MRDRLNKHYRAAAATLQDAAHLAKALADAVQNDFAQDWSQVTRRGQIDHSQDNATLYVDPHGIVKRATEMPKRLSLRKRIIDGRNRVTHRVEAFVAIFEAANIIRQGKRADRQKRADQRQHRREQTAQGRKDRISRMARNFASRFDRT